MNKIIYNKLLICADKLINKYPVMPLDKYDYVHECWDFESEDISAIRNKIYRYFYDELKKHHITLSSINKGADYITLDMLILKTTHYQTVEAFKQCKKCGDILPVQDFDYIKEDDYYRRMCKKCDYQTHKTDNAIKCKRYQQSEKYKEAKKLRMAEQKAKYPDQIRAYKRKYYSENKDKILEKKRQQRENGQLIDRTAHERYLRYKSKKLSEKEKTT